MWSGFANSPGLWGFLGALIYAAPTLTSCMFTPSEDHRHPIGRCIAEFLFATATGAIAGAAFAPWLLQHLGRQGDHELRAVAAMVGLLANPLAPKVIEALSGRFLTALKGDRG